MQRIREKEQPDLPWEYACCLDTMVFTILPETFHVLFDFTIEIFLRVSCGFWRRRWFWVETEPACEVPVDDIFMMGPDFRGVLGVNGLDGTLANVQAVL